MTPKKTRKNRYKKKPRAKEGRMLQRLVMGLKLFALVLLLLTVSALFMAGYAAVTQSEYFRTERIDVTGQSRLTKDELISQTGIAPGANLLAVNLSLVRKRLLAHPWISGARVAREIPATLRIHVTEHQAVAVVDLGRKFLLNAQGRIFKEYSDHDPTDLPLVSGIDYADISLGDDALGPALTAVLEALEISRKGKGALPYAAVERLHYDPELGISLRDRRNGADIRLGLGDYQKKYDRLETLVSRLSRDSRWQSFISIDLNNPDRAVVRF